MNKKLFVFLSFSLIAAALLSLSSCSFLMDKIDARLDEMGLSKEGGKVKEAWNGIGKEAIDGAVDDVLYGLDFKDRIGWPETGTAALIPRPFYEKLSSVNDSGDKGVIVIGSFTAYEMRKYIELLNKEGFEKYTDAEPVVYVNVGNTAAVCPAYDAENENLTLLYADGFAGVTLLIKETFRTA